MTVRGDSLVVVGDLSPPEEPGRRSASGIRQNIVGTGGGPLISFRGTVAANSLVRDDSHHGLLLLILRPTGWTQAFRTTDGVSRDAVSGRCRP
jgi:hypothetical protein